MIDASGRQINNSLTTTNKNNELSQNDEILRQIAELKSRLPKKPRKPKRLPVALTQEEFTLLIKKTLKMHHKIAFLLGFGSGLRISEITTLKPENVRFAEGNILIEQGKGSKDRTVPIPKGLKEAHLKYLPLKCRNRALEIAFKCACKRAGLLKNKPTLHFHSLRHGFATNAISKGIPIHHVRTLMGHSNISTTNVYLEMNPKDALKSYQDLF